MSASSELRPGGTTTVDDSITLMDQAESLQIPHLAWKFHPRCPPNLLIDNTGGGRGIGMTLEPTAWGEVLRQQLN